MNELSIRMVTAFKDLFPDAWKHDRHYSYDIGDTSCLKCNCKPEKLNKPCTVPDPIVIDWNVAMRLFREVNRKQRCFAMLQITETRRPETFKNLMTIYPDVSADKNPLLVAFSAGYFNHDATPADYTLAACIAKEAENEAM